MTTVVSDSTCLIGLERINRLDLLTSLFGTIAVPPEVQREVGATWPWLTVVSPSNAAAVASLKLTVDDGEAEAIALAVELGVPIILDDRRARIAARQMNLTILGTVGLLLRAKQQGLIPLVRPILDALHSAGFFINADLVAEALRLAGENS